MIPSSSFNYQEILKKSKRIDKKIIISDKNIKYLKKVPYTAFGTGIIITVFVWVCSLIGIISGSLPVLESFFASFLVFFLVSFFSYRALSKKMDLKSYKKLKKIIKFPYQVYEYSGKIDGIYDSIGVSTNTNINFNNQNKKRGNYIMMIDGQKVYLNSEVYEDLKKNKKITLYFAKGCNFCILFDYDR